MEFLNTFIEGARPGLNSIAMEADERLAREYTKFTKPDSTTLGYVLEQTYADLPPAVQVPEGAPGIPEFNRIPGFQLRVDPVMFGLQVRYTIQEAFTRQYQILRDHTRLMVASYRYAQEIEGAKLFNQGFTTFTSGDGQPVFSAAHPREDGGPTQSNRPSAHLPLTPNNLMSEITQFHLIRSGRGNRMPVIADTYKLIIPPQLLFTTKEILQSDRKAYTADNTENVIGSLDVVVSHYMDGSANWFLAHPDHDYKFWTRIPMSVEVKRNVLDITEHVIGEFAVSLLRWRFWRGVPEP